ncbi:MAG: protein kinase [Ktedonobacterales bacterium]
MATCPYCRTANRADAVYCNMCGAQLTGASAVHPAARATGAHAAVNGTGRLPPQALLQGHYQVVATVGQGGMAAVYKARELTTSHILAIKEMSQDGLAPDELNEALASFLFEADTLRRLRHPNLPRVYERFAEHFRQYLVMDFIEGQTLEQRLQAAGGKPLAQDQVLGWARQICDVLGYLHGQPSPIIFRDLKPANIMVTAGGHIYLIDFGIARVFAPGHSRDTQVLGTPGFAPPEQYGKAQTDVRADIYALGCTLYQLLTAYDPATTPFNLPPMSSRNPAIAPQVQHAIERATRLDRDARYRTVGEFARDLLAAAPAAVRATAAPAAATAARATAARATAARPVVSPKPTAPAPPPVAAARVAPRQPMAAIVVVQPHQVDFGKVAVGQQVARAITISGQGGVVVRGTITALAPWMRLDRTAFDGTSTVVQVSAEPGSTTATGSQQGMLQISCDGQQLFVPAAINVQPGKAKAAKAATAAPASAGSRRATAAPAKYGAQPPPARGRGVVFVMSLLVGVGFAAAPLALAPRVLALPLRHGVYSSPLTLALALLLAAGVLGGAGALAAAGGRFSLARLATSLLGGVAGVVVLLAAGAPWSWPAVGGVLATQVALRPVDLALAAGCAGLGGALGADRLLSQWIHAIARFAVRYARVLASIAAVLGGMYAGFAITHGFGPLAVCLTPLAVIGGGLVGLAVARLLRFALPAPRPRPRAPRMQRRYVRNWP